MPRVAAQQHRRQHFVNMRRRSARARPPHRLADADHAGVGRDAHDDRALAKQGVSPHGEGRLGELGRDVAIEGVGERGEERDGFDLRDFHGLAPAAARRSDTDLTTETTECTEKSLVVKNSLKRMLGEVGMAWTCVALVCGFIVIAGQLGGRLALAASPISAASRLGSGRAGQWTPQVSMSMIDSSSDASGVGTRGIGLPFAKPSKTVKSR